MRRSLVPALAALTACQLFYHVDATDDARGSDAHRDTGVPGDSGDAGSARPSLCVPKFRNQPHAALGSGMKPAFYVPNGSDGTRNVWLDNANTILEGEEPGSGVLALLPTVMLDDPRLEPDGLHMLAVMMGGPTPMPTFEITRDGSGATPWGSITKQAVTAGIPSTTTADGRAMVVDLLNNELELETREPGSVTWTAGPILGAAELGVLTMREPNLNADGRRITFVGQNDGTMFEDIWITDDPDGSGHFGSAQDIFVAQESGAIPVTPYLTEDCETLYYSSTATVQVVQRLQ